MKDYRKHIILLVKRLLLIYFLYFSGRLFFYLLNYNYFIELPVTEVARLFIYGLLFDSTAIVYTNAIFIICHAIPGNFKNNRKFQLILKVYFVIVNGIALFINLADSKFFQFEAKRTTADIFASVWFGHDFFNLLPRLLYDFWYIPLILVIFILLIIKAYPIFKKEIRYKEIDFNIIFLFKQSLVFIFICGLMLIGARGGIQMKPIRNIDGARFTSIKNISLVLNTPFSILKTLYKTEIAPMNYFSENEASKYFSASRQYSHTGNFKQMNVVVFILESFGKEYFGSLNNGKGFTLFLDSLISQSLVFDNAYANGKRSLDAVPSILTGIPALMDEPYITSRFSTNKINSLPNLLKEKGYVTSFFHGGQNGTMSFDLFAQMAGFDNYYGKNEFDGSKDSYDNNWGVYDEPFLQYFAKKLYSFKTPFFSTVFTLSSHHPYSIPPKYKNKFQKGPLDISESIRYTDFSLMKFFKTASKMPWFQNTLFIITADHTAQAMNKYFDTRVGMFSVPLIFFQPNDSTLKGINHTIAQQIDIMPSVLDYLHYNGPFISFGSSVFNEKRNNFSVNYQNGIYQIVNFDYCLLFNTEKSISLFNYRQDSLLERNLLPNNLQTADSLENILKSVIQDYSNRIFKNQLVIKK